MTNESISGFLTSIAEAKRAYDAEPDYQRQIRDLENDKRRLGDTVAQRELRIHELKQTEDSLLTKLRSVEAERDDAGFRALEETDKVQGLLTVVHGIINDALKVVSAVEGKESIVVNKVDHDDLRREVADLQEELGDKSNQLFRLQDEVRFAQEQLQRPLSSTEGITMGQGTEGVSGSGEMKSSQHEPWYKDTVEVSQLPPQQGWRDADLTATSSSGPMEVSSSGPQEVGNTASGQSDGPFAETTQTAQSEPVTSTTAEGSTDAASNASPPERNRDESTRFKGRKYFDVTYFVPLHEWLNKGGTREDYYWRPDHANEALPEPNRASHQS